MPKTSSHITACNIAASEAHNKREKELDYVRKDLTHLNESFSFIDHSLQTEEAAIKREVKDNTGRKLQKNAIPIKESCVVIQDSTTIDDLKSFCEECRKQFGIIPLQIHVHRDEGHVNSQTWKPNLHAHIVWRMYDENGRNVRLKRTDLSEMQDIAARCLNMERGKKSNKKHLSSLQFKIEMETKRLEELQKEIEGRTMTKERLAGAKEGVIDLFTGKTKVKYLEAEKRAEKAEKQAQEAIARAKAVAKQATALIEAEREQKEQVQKEWARHSEELREIATYREEREVLKNLLTDAAALGMTAAQTLKLSEEKQISVNHLLDRDGNKVSRADGKPIRIRLEKDGIKAWFACTWEKAWTWLRQAVNSPHFVINGVHHDRTQTRGRSV